MTSGASRVLNGTRPFAAFVGRFLRFAMNRRCARTVARASGQRFAQEHDTATVSILTCCENRGSR